MSLRRTLDAMGAMVERASSVPLSASCMVNRAEMLALVERARAELPVELDQAAELLVAHQEVISRAEAEAEELLAQAQADAEQMITESAQVAGARARSEQILDAARAEAARLLRECDLYCDNRLAALEGDLSRTLGQLRRGRVRLRDRSELDYLEPLADDADPQGYDVQAEHQRAVDRRQEQQTWAEQEQPGDDAYDHEAEAAYVPYDQEQDGAARSVAGPPTPVRRETAVEPVDQRDDQEGWEAEAESGDAGPPAGDPEPVADDQRIPAGVGAPLATGPEHRVLDLTAVERSAERSGLG